jgi:hypothetical protein
MCDFALKSFVQGSTIKKLTWNSLAGVPVVTQMLLHLSTATPGFIATLFSRDVARLSSNKE